MAQEMAPGKCAMNCAPAQFDGYRHSRPYFSRPWQLGSSTKRARCASRPLYSLHSSRSNASQRAAMSSKFSCS